MAVAEWRPAGLAGPRRNRKGWMAMAEQRQLVAAIIGLENVVGPFNWSTGEEAQDFAKRNPQYPVEWVPKLADIIREQQREGRTPGWAYVFRALEYSARHQVAPGDRPGAATVNALSGEVLRRHADEMDDEQWARYKARVEENKRIFARAHIEDVTKNPYHRPGGCTPASHLEKGCVYVESYIYHGADDALVAYALPLVKPGYVYRLSGLDGTAECAHLNGVCNHLEPAERARRYGQETVQAQQAAAETVPVLP